MIKISLFALLVGCGTAQQVAETKIIHSKTLGSHVTQVMQYKIKYDLANVIKNIKNVKFDKVVGKLELIHKETQLLSSFSYKQAMRRTDEIDFLAENNARYRQWSANLQKRLEAVNNAVRKIEPSELESNTVSTRDLTHVSKIANNIINELKNPSPYIKAADTKYKEINEKIEDLLITTNLIGYGTYDDTILAAIEKSWNAKIRNPLDAYRSFDDYLKSPKTKALFENLGRYLQIEDTDAAMREMWSDYDSFREKIIGSISNFFSEYVAKEAKAFKHTWDRQKQSIEDSIWDGLADWNGKSKYVWGSHHLLQSLLVTSDPYYVASKFTHLFVKNK